MRKSDPLVAMPVSAAEKIYFDLFPTTRRLLLSSAVVALMWVGLVLALGLQSGDTNKNGHNKLAASQLTETLAAVPLSFETNQGQFPDEVRFLSKGPGYNLFLTADNEAVLALRDPQGLRAAPSPKEMLGVETGTVQPAAAQMSVMRMRIAGSRSGAPVVAQTPLNHKTNYFVGNDPARWQVNVPQYARVKYEGVYPGIDLVYYGKQRQLEYDFVVQPGADPGQIKLAFEGVEKVSIDTTGELVLRNASGEIRQHAPVVYQEVNGLRQPVTGRYVEAGANLVAFEIGSYDRNQSLVIDPVLVYSTYLGGFDNEYGNGIEADSAGNAYVCGITYSADFPIKGPQQFSLRGVGNAWVAKFDPNGRLVYSTYLGGGGEDTGFAVAIDNNRNAYLTGTTSSANFPVTSNAVQSSRRGGLDSFVTKLSANGDELLYSTYLGGQSNDTGNSIAVDQQGAAYITGQTLSSNFPLRNAFQGSLKGPSDAYLTKLSPDGSNLVYSTYLGGNGLDTGYGVVVDSQNNPYLTGLTLSTDFPTRSAFQANNGGSVDAFITKFNAAGNALSFSTYVGGLGDDGGYGIGVDSPGNIYVAGFTNSANFPTRAPAQPRLAGGDDAFVLRLDGNGGLVYSTYLGGTGNDRSFDLAVDSNGTAYLIGRTESPDFPVRDAVQPKIGTGTGNLAEPQRAVVSGSVVEAYRRDGSGWLGEANGTTEISAAKVEQTVRDGFIAKFDRDGSTNYSTFLGGGDEEKVFAVATDNRGTAYCTGLTASANFPVKNPAQANLRGVADAFVTKIADVGNSQATVSAASYVGTTIAPDQIVSSFGDGLATSIKVATSLPLPTSFQGTEVKVEDSRGVERFAQLFFVSPTQINFVVPTASAEGNARITVWNNGAQVSNETIQIAKVAPGLFTANASGADVLAGVLLRVKRNGAQSFEPVARFDALLNRFVPIPLEFNNDELYLLLFGTGLRYRGGLPTVSASIGGTVSEVMFAGPQGQLVGLDQVNLVLPRTLIGRGEVNLTMTVDGKTANLAKIQFK